jgi:hypothetical protein
MSRKKKFHLKELNKGHWHEILLYKIASMNILPWLMYKEQRERDTEKLSQCSSLVVG